MVTPISNGVIPVEFEIPLDVPEKTKKIPIDQLIEDTIGSFGRYQFRIAILVFAPIICVGLQVMNWTFVVSEQIFPGNLSIFEIWEIDPVNRPQIKATVQSFFFIGQLIGSYATGVMGDKYGRKFAIFVALFILSVCGLLLPFCPNWWSFSLMKLGVGFSMPGLYGIPFLYGLEILGKAHRNLCIIFLNLFYASGMLIIPLTAYLSKNQYIFHLVLTAPTLLFMAYWWLIPESTRWLVAKGRFEEAQQNMRKAAHINGRPFPDNWLDKLDTKQFTESQSSPGIAPLFRTPEMRKRILASTVIWTTMTMLYFGITMKSDLNGGSLYISFILVCLSEHPGFIAAYFLINVLGRRLLNLISLFLCGVFLLLNLALSQIAPWWFLLCCILLCKVCSTCADDTCYTHLPEMMPTLLRNTALGYCCAISRFGAIFASFISFWLVDQYGIAVLLIPFSLFAFISAGLVQFCLPETHGKPLPETVDDVERKHI